MRLRVFGGFVGFVIEFGVGFALGEDVPDSGQDFTCDGDSSFFPPCRLFEGLMLVFEFGMLVRLRDSKYDLH